LKQHYLLFSWIHVIVSWIIGLFILYALTHSFGVVPAIIQTVHPVLGIWNNADTVPSESTIEKIHIQKKVDIAFTKSGSPQIHAQTDRDLWYSIGYLHAENRLFQMDLMRRQGSGQLAEILGKSALSSDQFERSMGLRQKAAAEWRIAKNNPELRMMIEAYCQAINDVITQRKKEHQLPLLFKLLGYEPKPWTPQDTFLVQGVMTQTMSYDINAIKYAAYTKSLGYERTMKLFPLYPQNTQHPYDDKANPLSHTPASANTTAKIETPLQTYKSLLANLQKLPSSAIHAYPASNAWVVDGTKTASGKPLLAGDPHLTMTLPSIWYELDASSPNYDFAGISIPGIPLIMIGKNKFLSWSLTSAQNQQTFYYQEEINKQNPNQYRWKNKWMTLQKRTEYIPVKGGSPVPTTITNSIHGPIIDTNGYIFSIKWFGKEANRSLESMLQIVKSKNQQQFRSALQNWKSPIMNFAYADQQGNIGMIAAGHYPIFPASTKPWLPMSGNGQHEVVGSIPFDQIPQSLNPKNHMIASANNIQVSSRYPYYIGTSMYFDPGYRTGRIYQKLHAATNITAADFQKLQLDDHNPLAEQITPVLTEALADEKLSSLEKTALAELKNWDYQMKADSIPAGIWETFWDQYLHETFDSWWKFYKVPVEKNERFAISYRINALAHWTLTDPNNEFFSNPQTKEKRNSKQVLYKAFRSTIQTLQQKYGKDPANWRYKQIQTRTIPSLSHIPALGYGPKAANGGKFTLNNVNGTMGEHGPSYRMIVDLANDSMYTSLPGGPSENPISPWYVSQMQTWWNGQYESNQQKKKIQLKLVNKGEK
jgi:penicillin amidase